MVSTAGAPEMYKSDIIIKEEMDCLPKRGSHLRYHIVHYVSSSHPVPAAGSGWAPPVDVYETAQDYVVEANLGGIDPEHVHVETEGSTIRLTGERLENGHTGVRCYHVLEIERGSFEREIELPTAVDMAKAEAIFHHGLLVLRIPKRDSRFIHGCFSADSMEGLE
jgi:HSP20 family molecular chaperone IbpA